MFETHLENIVHLTDELHVAVLDAVVHHLDVVASTDGAEVSRASLTVDLCGALGHDGLDELPRALLAAWHEGRAVAGALFAAGDAHADELDALLGQFLASTDGVGKPLVSAVDDDISLLHVLGKLRDGVVDGLSGLDEDDDLARLLELVAEVLVVRRARDGQVALGLGSRDGRLHLRRRPVADRDAEAVLRHVQREVLAHHGETPETNVRLHG